jgi:hypothetical protein
MRTIPKVKVISKCLGLENGKRGFEMNQLCTVLSTIYQERKNA